MLCYIPRALSALTVQYDRQCHPGRDLRRLFHIGGKGGHGFDYCYGYDRFHGERVPVFRYSGGSFSRGGHYAGPAGGTADDKNSIGQLIPGGVGPDFLRRVKLGMGEEGAGGQYAALRAGCGDMGVFAFALRALEQEVAENEDTH